MASPTPFAGKVIAITGAASGIGLATAHYLALRGASLSLADLNEKPLSEAKASIQKANSEAKILTTTINVTKAADVNAWIASTISTFHRLDGAANLAGVFSPSGNTITEMDDGEWDAVIGVNLTGVMYCLRAELKALERGGSIVNASSVAGLIGSSGFAAYTASKHGVVGLTRSAAREEGGRGVRVNCICPGRIDTPMMGKVEDVVSTMKTENQNKNERYPEAIVRKGKPEEVAGLIAYLLGDESKYVTGSSYRIDGGWLA